MTGKNTQQKFMDSGESGRENKMFPNVSLQFTKTESTKLLGVTDSLRRKRKGFLINPENRILEHINNNSNTNNSHLS